MGALVGRMAWMTVGCGTVIGLIAAGVIPAGKSAVIGWVIAAWVVSLLAVLTSLRANAAEIRADELMARVGAAEAELARRDGLL